MNSHVLGTSGSHMINPFVACNRASSDRISINFDISVGDSLTGINSSKKPVKYHSIYSTVVKILDLRVWSTFITNNVYILVTFKKKSFFLKIYKA